MLEYGFLERQAPAPTVEEVLSAKRAEDPGVPQLITVASHEKLGRAIELMQRYSISQLPVVRHEPVESLADLVGSLQERGLLDRVFKNPDALNDEVAAAMQPPLTAVDAGESIDEVFSRLDGSPAVVVVARRRAPGRDAHALGPARVPRAPPQRSNPLARRRRTSRRAGASSRPRRSCRPGAGRVRG